MSKEWSSYEGTKGYGYMGGAAKGTQGICLKVEQLKDTKGYVKEAAKFKVCTLTCHIYISNIPQFKCWVRKEFTAQS